MKRTEWESTRGKRMGHWRAGCSSLFWYFLKHRGKNVGYFWVQHWNSPLHSAPLNTATDGFKEEIMNTSERKHGFQCTVPFRFEDYTSSWMKPILLETLKRQQIIYLGIDKNNFSVRLVSPGLVWLDVASGCYNHNTGERNTEEEIQKTKEGKSYVNGSRQLLLKVKSQVNAVWDS